MRLSFPHPLLVLKGHVESTGEYFPVSAEAVMLLPLQQHLLGIEAAPGEDVFKGGHVLVVDLSSSLSPSTRSPLLHRGAFTNSVVYLTVNTVLNAYHELLRPTQLRAAISVFRHAQLTSAVLPVFVSCN